jgi:hypothetical protein
MRRHEPELRSYNAKRHFGTTDEPKGEVAGAKGHAFVIQKPPDGCITICGSSSTA